MVEEIGDFLERVEGTVVGIHQFGCFGLAAAVLIAAVASLLGVAATGLVAAAALGTGFLGLAVLLVVATRQLGRLRDRLGCGRWVGRGPDDTPPLGRRGSTPRPGPSAR